MKDIFQYIRIDGGEFQITKFSPDDDVFFSMNDVERKKYLRTCEEWREKQAAFENQREADGQVLVKIENGAFQGIRHAPHPTFIPAEYIRLEKLFNKVKIDDEIARKELFAFYRLLRRYVMDWRSCIDKGNWDKIRTEKEAICRCTKALDNLTQISVVLNGGNVCGVKVFGKVDGSGRNRGYEVPHRMWTRLRHHYTEINDCELVFTSGKMFDDIRNKLQKRADDLDWFRGMKMKDRNSANVRLAQMLNPLYYYLKDNKISTYYMESEFIKEMFDLDLKLSLYIGRRWKGKVTIEV